MLKGWILSLVLCLWLPGYEIKAQTTIEQDSTYVFELENGKTITGKVKIIIPGESYRVKVGKKWKVILDEEIVDFYYTHALPEVQEVIFSTNQHGHKYMLYPSSYGLKKGESYYQNYFIASNHLGYGISDHFSLSIGLSPSLIIDYATNIGLSLSPKLSFPNKRGTGAYAISGTYFQVLENQSYIMAIQFSKTMGTLNKQVTLGLGYVYASEITPSIDLYVLGQFRTMEKIMLVTENHFAFANNFKIHSGLGCKYIRKKLSITFGGMISIGEVLDQDFRFIVLPWLSGGYAF